MAEITIVRSADWESSSPKKKTEKKGQTKPKTKKKNEVANARLPKK